MKNKLNYVFRNILKMYDQIANDQISVFASQAAFFIVISAIPMLMMILNIIQFVSPEVKDQMIRFIQGFTPVAMNDMVSSIINELYHKSSGTLISFSALTTLWFSSKGIGAIEIGLNNIYKNKKQMNYIVFRLVSLLYTVAFLIIFWLFLLIMMFGDTLQKIIIKHLPVLGSFIQQVINLRMTTALLVLFIFFVLLYGIFPGRKFQILSQIPGAIFATAGWILFSYGYSYYINNFSNFSYMYGSLTAAVLLLLWLYFFMMILLLGAEINLVFPLIKKNIKRMLL